MLAPRPGTLVGGRLQAMLTGSDIPLSAIKKETLRVPGYDTPRT